MTPLTLDQFASLRAMLAAATPGPWFDAYNKVWSKPVSDEHERLINAIPNDAPDEAYEGLPEPVVCHVETISGDCPTKRGTADAALIVAAVNALPALLDAWAERERLRAALAEAKSYLLADEERRKLTGDALYADGQVSDLRTAIRDALNNWHTSHQMHWDREGQHGAACPACHEDRKLRERLRALVSDGEPTKAREALGETER